MRPVKVTLSAVGSSAWIPVNEIANIFQVGLAVSLTSGASLTYNVQHTFDETGPDGYRAVSVSRSGTTATVVDNDHRLSAADNVLIESSGSSNLDGSFAVATIVDANTYTYTVANTGATTDQGNTRAHNFRVYPHAILTAQTARLDGNYAFQVQAVRLNLSIYASGKADLTVLQGK